MDFIYERKNALPDDFCDELIETFEGHSGVADGITAEGVSPDKKRSHDLTLERFEDLHEIRQRLLDFSIDHFTDYFIKYPYVGSINPVLRINETGARVSLTMDNVSTINRDVLKSLIPRLFRSGVINIQKYDARIGGYRHWHSEIYPDPDFEGLHRIILWMYYLNDVVDGGETEFYFQERAFQPTKGTMIIAPAGFTHTHRGNTPLSNDKYIATSWLLYQRGGGHEQ